MDRRENSGRLSIVLALFLASLYQSQARNVYYFQMLHIQCCISPLTHVTMGENREKTGDENCSKNIRFGYYRIYFVQAERSGRWKLAATLHAVAVAHTILCFAFAVRVDVAQT